MKEHKRITITVTDAVYSRLKSHGKDNDWTVPVLVRRTIVEAVDSNCLPTVGVEHHPSDEDVVEHYRTAPAVTPTAPAVWKDPFIHPAHVK